MRSDLLCLVQHVDDAIEHFSRRSDQLDKRRCLMDAWASYAAGAEVEIVRIGT